ncbi:hypothetical protein GGR56DRAFT_675132 [Xylariaceae sp. FL0804]|nr:hypothetical protein GGR56DRAFT_675132 [Xylariaceae sp. FL0804]
MQLPSLTTTAGAGVLLGAAGAAAQFNMLRFACSQLVVDRIDPLVNPGFVYTPHLHQLVGGSSLNTTMDPATHNQSLSSCTSCTFAEDKSNYWTAVMFYQARNGSYRRVPQVGDGGPQGQLVNNGGLDVYYIPGFGTDGSQTNATTAFAPGFRMLAGDAAQTNASAVDGAALCHRCWTDSSDAPDAPFVGGAPCTGDDTVEIPSDPSCKMIRQNIIFPTCWDGVNLDSPDHQSHVAYGEGSGATGGGACPSTHPVRLPQVMYELMWNVTDFVNDPDYPTDGSNPYIYSMGIGGSAAHGDYMFGWEGDTLQKAMDNGCNLNADCAAAGIHAQTPDAYGNCTIPQQAPEQVDGWLDALPLGGMKLAGSS